MVLETSLPDLVLGLAVSLDPDGHSQHLSDCGFRLHPQPRGGSGHHNKTLAHCCKCPKPASVSFLSTLHYINIPSHDTAAC